MGGRGIAPCILDLNTGVKVAWTWRWPLTSI